MAITKCLISRGTVNPLTFHDPPMSAEANMAVQLPLMEKIDA